MYAEKTLHSEAAAMSVSSQAARDANVVSDVRQTPGLDSCADERKPTAGSA
jgi:hypothetical protein